eukprot:7425291-Pyramimonas_sp.AAC.1
MERRELRGVMRTLASPAWGPESSQLVRRESSYASLQSSSRNRNLKARRKRPTCPFTHSRELARTRSPSPSTTRPAF